MFYDIKTGPMSVKQLNKNTHEIRLYYCGFRLWRAQSALPNITRAYAAK